MRIEVLHQERRGQVKTIVIKHFNGILFHNSGPANKQNTNQSIRSDLDLLKVCKFVVYEFIK